MKSETFDHTVCELGEGAFWHPLRQQFFWFDVLGQKLLSRKNDVTTCWDFDRIATAAAWIDQDTLLIATATDLSRFDIATGAMEHIVPLEADNPITISNDGRADPFGGFWIGTMAKSADPNAGAIYRYYRGEMRKLFPDITIPNAICFSPDGQFAYFTDSTIGIVMVQELDQTHGWPTGDPKVFLDASGQEWVPDGAVVDVDGNFWNAQWGGWRVAGYSPDGKLIQTVSVNAAHASCPAFGGGDRTTLFCTTARKELSPQNQARSQDHGKTFFAENVAKGQAEHPVVL